MSWKSPLPALSARKKPAVTKRNDAAEVQRRAARRDPRQLGLVDGIGYRPKPRKARKAAVPNGIDEKRMAYLEGLAAFVEGHERASPYVVGTPLTKDWLRGYERADEARQADVDLRLSAEDEIREDLRYDEDLRDEIKDELREDEGFLAEIRSELLKK
jgi:hypothetical protein